VNVYRVRSIVEVETKGGNLRQIYSSVDKSRLSGIDWIEHFNGKPYTLPWKTVTFFLDKPKLKRADFLNFAWKVLVCNERAMNVLGDVLRGAGDVFPAAVAGDKEKYFFCNPTNLLKGAFDKANSEYVKLPTHKTLMAPAFHAKKIPADVQLFKTPQVSGIYCVERTGRAEDGEFKALVDQHQLTGLEFKLMWSDGKGPTKQKATKGKTKVIKPPAPPPPPKAKVAERPLKASEKKDVELSIARGYEALKLKPKTPADKTQSAIRKYIDSVALGKRKLSSRQATDAAVNVGCLWGQTICDAAGWEWCFVKGLFVVASKDRAHMVAPMHFVQEQLKKRAPQENTSALLFNMIKARRLPRATSKSYLMIG
jgi:hypothetical protein